MWIEKFYLSPWPHLIIDNFYDAETWAYVSNKNQLFSKYKDLAKVKATGISFDFIDDTMLLQYFSKKLPLHYLERKFTNHRDFDQIHPTVHLKVSRLPKLYDIHDENPHKIFSVITCVQPEHSVGTILFNKDKELDRVITWKPNRAIIFAPIDHVTWHSFGNWDNTDRYTVDFFWQT